MVSFAFWLLVVSLPLPFSLSLSSRTTVLGHVLPQRARTIQNPRTKRRIRVGGPTYREFLQTGEWIQHDGTLQRLNLEALSWSSPSPSLSNLDRTEDTDAPGPPLKSVKDDWYPIVPSVVVVSPASSSSSSLDMQPPQKRPLTNAEASLLSQQLLFVHKPAGLHCTPPRDSSMSSLTDLVNQAHVNNNNYNNNIIKPCHRLDRDTSGVVVYGVTPQAHRHVSMQFEARTVHKHYVTLVRGNGPCLHHQQQQQQGIVDLAIGKMRTAQGHHCWTTEKGCDKPRQAITHWRVDRTFVYQTRNRTKDTTAATATTTGATTNDTHYPYTRLLLEPHTGRGHQLRLHMRAMNCPILGDTLHGDRVAAACAPRLCLHAWRLELEWNGMSLEAESVPPF